MISFKGPYFRFNTRQIYIVLVLILVKSNLVFSYTFKEYAEKPFGNVLFIRHAMAPGYGDPPYFVLNDCSTQRNLNNDGKTQAVKIGRIIKREGIKNLITPISLTGSHKRNEKRVPAKIIIPPIKGTFRV